MQLSVVEMSVSWAIGHFVALECSILKEKVMATVDHLKKNGQVGSSKSHLTMYLNFCFILVFVAVI